MAWLRASLWLIGCSSVGFVLLQLFPGEVDKTTKKRPDFEAKKQTKLFLDVIKGAAEDSKPLYLQSPEELKASREKYIEEQK